jgi:hypothetical protein
MKKSLSLLSAVLLFFMLLSPLSAAADGLTAEPYLSQSIYAPAANSCLYIYVPLSGSLLACTVEIYDSYGVLVYQARRENLSTNVQTYLWDARPAAGNGAAYDSGDYVQPGNYDIHIRIDSQGTSREFLLSVWILLPDDTAAYDEQGIPNLTGNAQCDYLAEQILAQIGVGGLSNAEKYHAIYTWVQENCYRENSTYSRPEDESGYFYDLDALAGEINLYQAEMDVQHKQGRINYDIHGDLETKMALKMMLERVGTCYEFSALLQILLEHVGIECHVYGGYFHNSDGSSVIHKWNRLRLNGAYYWSDVRIDNASFERSGRTSLYYDYYLERSTSTWKERHSWEEDAYPQYSTRTPAFDTFASNSTDSFLQNPSATRGPADYALSAFTDFSDRKAISTDADLRIINGASYLLEAYNIDGYNYFKLRDIACILSGSEVQFDVGWSETDNRITLTAAAPYTHTGGELSRQSLRDPVASPTSSEILLDGEPVVLSAYFINGSNYFRLRDLAILFNFAVGWDEAANTVLIDPLYEYSE